MKRQFYQLTRQKKVSITRTRRGIKKMTDKIIKVMAAGFYCFMYVWYSRKAIKAVEAILTT
jgi:hypothetical protein